MSSTKAALCVSQKQKAGRADSAGLMNTMSLRRSTIYFLHRNRDRGRVSGGPAIRNPVTGFRIAHQFVRGPISLRLWFTAENIFGYRDLGSAIHEVNRNCRDRLGRLVIKDLHRLDIIENIEVLIVTFVARATQFLTRFFGGHADTHALEIAKQGLSIIRQWPLGK